MLRNEDMLKEIIRCFSYLQSYIYLNNSIAFTDINISVESFVMKLLNILEEGNFYNCNNKNINYKNIDLYDQVNDIGIQITSDCSSTKIKKTLLEKNIGTLKFFFLNDNYYPRQSAYTDFPFFNVKKDVYNFSVIIKIIQEKEKILDIYNFIIENVNYNINNELIGVQISRYTDYQTKRFIENI